MLELKKGDKIQDYTLVDFINSGTSADVWQVEDYAGRVKALKIFAPAKGVDGITMDLLVEEFKLTIPLDHPNVLKPENIGVYRNIPYIVMPYCTSSLAEEITRRLVKRKRSQTQPVDLFSEQECATLLLSVCQGLGYLHENDIIHQDVKPENILMLPVEEDTRYVISDFGISQKLKQNVLRQTMQVHHGSSQLTPAYAAPEQFKGYISATSDVFSLGVIAWEMAEGRLPFATGKSTAQYLDEGAVLPAFTSETSGDFRRLVTRCLEVNPKDRPSIAGIISVVSGIRSAPEGHEEEDISGAEMEAARSDRRTERQEPKWIPAEEAAQTTERNIPVWRDIQQDVPVFPAESRPGYSPARSRRSRGLVYVVLAGIATLGLAGAWAYNSYKNLTELKKKSASITNVHESARPFAAGLQAVKKPEGWGFINEKGENAIPFIYDEVIDFQPDGVAAVLKNGLCGLINSSGKKLTQETYTFCRFLGENKWSLEEQAETGSPRIKKEFNSLNSKLNQ